MNVHPEIDVVNKYYGIPSDNPNRSQDTCTGCDNAAIEFSVAKEQYDEAAQIRELFSQAIDWSEDVTHLS